MKSKENIDRRKFISQCAGGSAALLSVMLLLNSCGENKNNENKEKPVVDKEEGNKPTDPCNDFTDVSDEELDKRKKLGYVDKSAVQGNSCSNCGLYIPFTDDSGCGKCLLFKGPVHAEGHCIQYVAKA
ncbi:MAG: high-potential iron-sulfur protein [Bacteroidetes bacterium]|nr:high-potential iron-sulfur protein [Bacteroidota bacterium]